jgi:hypothetical protein
MAPLSLKQPNHPAAVRLVARFLRTARLRLIWIAGADMAVVEAMRSRVFRLSDLAHDTSTDRPQSVGNSDWIDIALFPPRDFIADLVVLVVVIPA